MTPSGSIDLPEDEVHVWYASLGQAAQLHARLLALLSPDEGERARRFYFEVDRLRSVAVRGTLRILLGRYLDLQPEEIRFTYGQFGKPALGEAAGARWLHFNVSHSEDLAVFAFARSQPVGVDAERIRSITDESRFAAQLFSPAESAILNSLSGYERVHAFFRLWTAKEAFLKAAGLGLTIPLDRIEIALAEDGSPRLVAIEGQAEQARTWRLQAFNPLPDYEISLAIESAGCRILCFPVPEDIYNR
ncbi:MAG TPA: 4'-phosphopantetheinyl transferase superfamily protein [Anaerolineales bacterium]